MVLQDGNLLLLTSSTSGRNYSRSGRKSLYPDLAYGAPNQSIFPAFFHGLFDFLYAQLTFYMLNSTFYMAN